MGVIGDPVRHSLSPVLHNAAFTAAGLDWVYVAFPVATGQGAAAVAAARTMGIEGLSVTMPHKAAVAGAVDRLGPAAAALGVANTVVRRGDELVGESTDGEGFVSSLRADAQFDPRGRRCVVLGSGGASRAVVLALVVAGASEVVVVGRTEDHVADAVNVARAGAVGSSEARGGVVRGGTIDEVGDAELVVNATPVGMHGATGDLGGPDDLPLRLDPERLHAGQLVADLVYSPPVTPLLAAATAHGARGVNGLGMLVHQAARQFELWTGVEAPIAVMGDAAATALADRSPR